MTGDRASVFTKFLAVPGHEREGCLDFDEGGARSRRGRPSGPGRPRLLLDLSSLAVLGDRTTVEQRFQGQQRDVTQ